MSREEFEQALAAHGADFARWPESIAAGGQALAARDGVAAAQLAKARRLEALLAEVAKPAAVDSAMIGRIIAGVAGGHPHETAVRPTGRLFAWAGGAMAMFMVVGFVLGLAVPSISADDDAFSALMFGASDTGTSAIDGDIL